MKNRLNKKRLCRYQLILTCLILFYSTSVMSGESEEIWILLKAYDDAFFSSYSINFQASFPITSTTEEGIVIREVNITGDDTRHAMVLKRPQLEVGRFFPLKNSLGTLRNDKPFYLGVPINMFIFLSDTNSTIFYEMERITLFENHISASSLDAQSHIEIFPPDHENPNSNYFKFILPFGRGFTRLLNSINSVNTNEDGIMFIEGNGNFFSDDLVGIWQLEVDTNNDYIVRKSEFVVPNISRIVTVSNVTNIFNDGITQLFNEGKFIFTDFHITNVTLSSYSNNVDESLIDEVSTKINSYSAGDLILDHNVIDSEGNVLTIKVP